MSEKLTQSGVDPKRLLKALAWFFGSLVLVAMLLSTAAVELQGSTTSLDAFAADSAPVGDGSSSGSPPLSTSASDAWSLQTRTLRSTNLTETRSASSITRKLVLTYAPKTSPPALGRG